MLFVGAQAYSYQTRSAYTPLYVPVATFTIKRHDVLYESEETRMSPKGTHAPQTIEVRPIEGLVVSLVRGIKWLSPEPK